MATISNDPVFHWRSALFLCHFPDHEESMVFYFDPENRPKDTVKMSIVKKGGFIIDDPSEDPYSIVLRKKTEVTSTSAKLQNFDYFDAKFIKDSVKANKLQDLNQYRIGKSVFYQYNANEILLRRNKWSDIVKRSPRRVTTWKSTDAIPSTSLPPHNREKSKNEKLAKLTAASTSNAARLGDQVPEISPHKSPQKLKKAFVDAFSRNAERTANKTPVKSKEQPADATVSSAQKSLRRSPRKLPETLQEELVSASASPNNQRTRGIPAHKSPEKAKVKSAGASHVDTGNALRKGSLARKLAERSAGPLMTSTPLVTSRMSNSPKRGEDKSATTVRESSEIERGPSPPLPSTSTWVRAVRESFQSGTKATRVQHSPPGRPATPVSPMSSLSEDDNFSFASTDSRRKRTRRDYTEPERKEILKYIIQNDFYLFTGGVKMWTYLEKLKIVPGHTAQSLKEHCRKKILPNLHTFKLPPDVLKKFKTAQAELRHKKYSNEAPIDLVNMKILK